MAEAAHAVTGGSTGTTGGFSASHSVNVCESCHKTKFADVSGNPCIYCKRRTCTRCGGHMEIKPNIVSLEYKLKYCKISKIVFK